MLLVDPETREPIEARSGELVEAADRWYARTHWEPGWRSGMDYEDGIPVRMWFAQCQDPCCDAFRCEPLPEPGESW